MAFCIFCKIAAKEIPADIVYEDDEIIAFNDLNPQAPTHILVIPKNHIESVDHAEGNDKLLLGKLLMSAATIAKSVGLSEKGYRVVTNVGDDGGQSVNHLHLHVLGGRHLTWPPG